MGAIAEAMIAYAQPLLEGTDGSHEQMNKALSLSGLCFNLAQMPADRRREAMEDIKSSFQLSDEEFADFQSSVVLPMIERYELMFSNKSHAGHSDFAPTHFELDPDEPSGRTQPVTVDSPVKKSEPLP